jgi:hypothetical protein
LASLTSALHHRTIAARKKCRVSTAGGRAGVRPPSDGRFPFDCIPGRRHHGTNVANEEQTRCKSRSYEQSHRALIALSYHISNWRRHSCSDRVITRRHAVPRQSPSGGRRPFSQQRRPIDDHCQWLGSLLLRRSAHQEALAIGRGLIGTESVVCCRQREQLGLKAQQTLLAASRLQPSA